MATDLNPQTQRARVTIFLNGSAPNAGKLLTFDFLHAKWADLLETARVKLGADKPFTRVFVQNGAEAESLGDIFPGDDLYFSHGEAFVAPPSEQPSASSATSASSSAAPAAATGNADEKAGDTPTPTSASVSVVTRSAQAVASAAEKLYTQSADFIKSSGPTVVKVTLERVEDSVGAIKPQIVERVLQVTQWADEKLDNAYQSLQKKKSDFLASPVGQQANQYFNASALGVQSLVIEPSQAFLHASAVKFHQLQAASQDGKVAVESFVASLKEHLGTAWNDRLVEPAKAAHEAISKEVAARVQQIGDNKTVQQVREVSAQLAAEGSAQLQAAKERLGRAWSDVVVANFQSKVVVPADAFYQLALNNYMQLRASGNGRVTLNEFVAALRATTGRLWNEHLLPPAQHLYNNFTLAAAHARDAVSHSREVPSNDVELQPVSGGKGAAGSQ